MNRKDLEVNIKAVKSTWGENPIGPLAKVVAAAEAYAQTLPESKIVEYWVVTWENRYAGEYAGEWRIVGEVVNARRLAELKSSLAEGRIIIPNMQIDGPFTREIVP
jgi:hypothetical protein